LEGYRLSKMDANNILNKLNLPEKRFKSFFDKEMIKFSYCGLEGYVKREMDI
jgi:hypothetical protein